MDRNWKTLDELLRDPEVEGKMFVEVNLHDPLSIDPRIDQALRLVRNHLEWLNGWGVNWSEVVEGETRAALDQLDAALDGNLQEGGLDDGPTIYRERRKKPAGVPRLGRPRRFFFTRRRGADRG